MFLCSEEYIDLIKLQQTNTHLTEELQEMKDRHFQSQRDKKVEMKELEDKSTALAEELKRSKAEALRYREEVVKMKKICQEAGEKERELKTALERLEAARQEIRELHQKVEDEQDLSFQISIRQKKEYDDTVKMRIDHATRLSMHKEFRLEAEAQLCRRVIEYRREQAGQLIGHLMSLNNLGPAGCGLVNRLVGELNQYVASLIAATDEVAQLLAEKCRRVAEEPDLMTGLEFDLGRVEVPPVGHELVPLLVSVSANPPPPGGPYAGYSFGVAPSVPPPGYAAANPTRPQFPSRPLSFGKHSLLR